MIKLKNRLYFLLFCPVKLSIRWTNRVYMVKMEMTDSLLWNCMSSYTWNSLLFTKFRIYSYEFVRVSSILGYEGPILYIATHIFKYLVPGLTPRKLQCCRNLGWGLFLPLFWKTAFGNLRIFSGSKNFSAMNPQIQFPSYSHETGWYSPYNFPYNWFNWVWNYEFPMHSIIANTSPIISLFLPYYSGHLILLFQ